MLYVAWKRGLPWKFTHFVPFVQLLKSILLISCVFWTWLRLLMICSPLAFSHRFTNLHLWNPCWKAYPWPQWPQKCLPCVKSFFFFFCRRSEKKTDLFQISDHLSSNSPLNYFQSTCKTEHSTETAVLKMVNHLLLSLVNGNISVVTFLIFQQSSIQLITTFYLVVLSIFL